MVRFIFLVSIICLSSCTNKQQSLTTNYADPNTKVQLVEDYLKGKDYSRWRVATFAGGCFWCTEAAFERIAGVKDVISGYSGGSEAYPSYEQVSAKQTTHAEAIQIFYDPAQVDFATLLKIFFVAHDPTQLNRQGPDVGPQYRSAIYFHDIKQKELAEAYIAELEASGKFAQPIVTELAAYDQFWVAEGYHQDYYEQHPNNPYIRNVSRPKVEKVKKTFPDLLKKEYRK